ncbi:MAG: protease pro-enzyme activation domain-containing protein, partial [Terracidiphilus sp.]
MRLLRILFLGLSAVSLIHGTQAFTQSAAPRATSTARILERVDENQLVTLTGNTHPAANARNDLGPVRPDLAMTDVVLVLSRDPEQQASFDEFVSSQYDSSSPNFHHWLRPTEVGERFGPSLTDIATVSNWLASHGLSVSAVSKDRMSIRFGGTAAQVQSAFHTEIHNLSISGERHIANMSDPQIPAALAPVVVGVKALHDFKPKPQHRLGATVSFDSATGKWQRASASPTIASASGTGSTAGVPKTEVKAHPDFGITVGTGSSAFVLEDVAPYDFATIYNVLPLWTATTPITGTGQTIAIAGTSDITLSDVAAFRSAFGLPAGLTPQEVKGANGADPGICTSTTATTCNIEDLTENTLDVEWSGAVAPGAQIVLVASGAQSSTDDTVYDSSSYVVENIGDTSTLIGNAYILNVSYGLCELAEGTGGNAAYNNLWQTAASEGIAVFVATGDAGSASCDQGLDTTTPYEAVYGVSVSGLASTPYNTAVGGTDLNWGATASPYWNATNAATTGASAKGYMPEVPWNDTCTNPLTLTFIQQTLAPALQKAGFTTATAPTDIESGCQFILKWYQTVASTFSVDVSGYVDVAGAGGGVSSCTTSDGQTVASCTGGYPKPTWQAGATGIPADGKRDVPDVSFFASNGFLGSAYLICVTAALPSGTTSCTYSATAEQTAEEVGGTSVASPAMAGVMALINQKMGTPQGSPNAELYSLAAKQNYASCSTESVTVSSSCYFNDIDTGTNAMPCKPGSTSTCPAVVHSGDTVSVLSGYGAAAGFDEATGLGSLNVANVVNAWTASTGTGTATVTVTPAQTAIVVNQGLSVTVALSVTSGTPTGTVTLAGPGYAGGTQTVSTSPYTYTFTIPADGLSGGTDTLTASYSGDANFAEAHGSAVVTVAKLTPTITVTPGSSSISSGASLTVTGTIAGAGPTPTGTVTLSGGGYTSAATVLTTGSYSVTIPANSLSVGSDTLTASYSGDGNYTTVSGMATVTVTAAVAATYSLSAAATTAVAPGGTATSAITVTSTTGYAGTVTMTCALNSGGPANQSGDAPACSIPGTAVSAGGKATATVTTTAVTTGALVRPDFRRNGLSLAGLGGAGLALLFLLRLQAWRRSWQSLLGVLTLLLALGGLA